ncbi:uncharacterized protein LOC132276046 [Cornus florida]|uniref:uncharacterized protein LOC132276046 n=1 Tax=Cornus florida TaxID=4283 RepID=UPI0028967345|nr:uncharacterized protein LOC132276046 [Cornus florida]
MDFSEDWKSLWPISSVFSAPSLLSSVGGGGGASSTKSKDLGPLVFNPVPETLTQLFASPSLAPLLPPPYPRLSLSRFLQTSAEASILHSTSTSVGRSLGPQLSDSGASTLPHNRLQLLRCGPKSNSVLAFFPTGDNSDRIGFLLLSVQDRKLNARGDGGKIFTAKTNFNHRIVRLSINPVADWCSSSGKLCYTTVGYLLAYTMYSVHWFRVRIRGLGTDSERPVLDTVGSKLFKSSSVAHACWSPHLCEESVVLLENGDLFLFDLDSCSKTQGLSAKFIGKRLRVRWDDSISLEEGGWLSCEFSWHPRILIVAHSNAVFLVDLRSGEGKVSCLLKNEKLVMDTVVLKDPFVEFSKVGSDGFYFAVASGHWLLLCDLRKPLMPLLRWAHDLDHPSYIDVFPLSVMRSHSNDGNYKWASESGYCIVMGSFWNCDFSSFCYGPPLSGSVAAEISKGCKSFYAWELPSELSLSGRECPCGSCLVREEFSKDALPEWIDWRQKKEIVLGFGFLDKDLSTQLFEKDSFGGFTLIRLMSSGKLELQRYCASWEFQKKWEETHKEPPLHFEDSLLYAVGDAEYTFSKSFYYLKLDFLNGYMKGNLAKVLGEKMIKPCKGPREKESFSIDCHQYICEKLKACGFSRKRSTSTVSEVLKDTSLPTTIHEIASRNLWVGLPMDLLQLAFSTYSEFLEVLVDKKKVSLEFLNIPLQPQLPPFFLHKPSCRSSKWSKKVQPGDAPAGPVLPLPILLTLHKLRVGEEADVSSADTQLSLKCNEVMQVANEIAMSGSGSDLQNDHAVHLGDDRDEMYYGSQKDSCYGSQKVNIFSLHEPVAFSEKMSSMDKMPENSASKDERFTTLVFKTPEKKLVSNVKMEMDGPDMFDALCPLELKFNDCATKFGPKELKTYKLLNRQFSKFLEGF